MLLKEIFHQIKVNSEFLLLRKVKKRSVYINVRNDNVKNVSREFDEGIMIELMVDGFFGYAGTSDLSLKGVQLAVDKALQLAKQSSRYPLHVFNLQQRPPMVGQYVSEYQTGFDKISIAEISAILIDVNKQMKISEKIVNRECSFVINETDTEMISTNGCDVRQILLRSHVQMSVVASDEKTSQRRTWGGNLNAQRGLEVLQINNLINNAKQIATEAIELLNADNCPNGKMDLLLNPDQMYLQIHESIGHPLELDRILGDERNYAGWSFVQPKDFGSLQYGSKLMNVTFDPTVKGQNASYLFDDIGAQASRQFLIKDGLLQKGLGSLESQTRLKVGGVSSQRATSWNRPPIDRMANLNLEPGDSELSDMISSIKLGVLMMSNRSWSIDDYRNKFQFGCEYGKLIENGKITKTVKNPNYRGQTSTFWQSLKMVGNRKSWEVGGLTNCGKGEPNQIMFVGHASPYCLFSDIEVFGGG